mmetsp:Transcript_3853/g.24423  ORF Transcript_3853/g.24423 Transcript_3853/m.24423 type:complete len:336 (+) Transcript_3853:1331-2338(+)
MIEQHNLRMYISSRVFPRPNQEVTRMRVAMYESIEEDHVGKHLCHFLGHQSRFEPHLLDSIHIGDFGSVCPFHGQHLFRGELPHDGRHHQSRTMGEILRCPFGVLPFPHEIQFFFQVAFQLRYHPFELESFEKHLGSFGQPTEGGDVCLRFLQQACVLDLDRHVLTVVGARTVHLGQRGGGCRLFLERSVQFHSSSAQRCAQRSIHLCERSNGRTVVQLGESFAHFLRHSTHRGGHLRRLDVRTAVFLRQLQQPRSRVFVRLLPSFFFVFRRRPTCLGIIPSARTPRPRRTCSTHACRGVRIRRPRQAQCRGRSDGDTSHREGGCAKWTTVVFVG